MKYYLTTPIYYVNAAPHIGHAYTTIVADLIKRFKRMQGYDAKLTTGSDEHGINVERSAERAGKPPKEFCDTVAAEFARQWNSLGLDIDFFQRTSSPQHARVVNDLFRRPRQRVHLQGIVHRAVLHFRQSVRERRQAGRSVPGLRAADRDDHGGEFLFQAFRISGQAARAIRTRAAVHSAGYAPQRGALVR